MPSFVLQRYVLQALREKTRRGPEAIIIAECITNVLNAPSVEDANDQGRGMKADERPCPSCRGPISKTKLFNIAAFETQIDQDADLDDSDNDSDLPDATTFARKKGKKRSKGKGKGKMVVESDDDMSDFIVNSDEDEDEKDRKRAEKGKLKGKEKGKAKAKAEILSDDDYEEDIKPAFSKYNARTSFISKAEKDKLLEITERLDKFLPSTKVSSELHWRYHYLQRMGLKALPWDVDEEDDGNPG